MLDLDINLLVELFTVNARSWFSNCTLRVVDHSTISLPVVVKATPFTDIAFWSTYTKVTLATLETPSFLNLGHYSEGREIV